jgi:ABC-type transport system substrate-binding protein
VDQALNVIAGNPTLKYREFNDGMPQTLFFKTDNTKLPFQYKAVRQAISMAINRDAIVKSMYAGHAPDVFNFPVSSGLPEFEGAGMWKPLSAYSQTIQDIYTYNVDKSKALLASAGYASGFTTSIVCQQTQVDMLTIIKSDLAKVGITMNLDVKDSTSWSTIGSAKTFTEMYCYPWDPAAVTVMTFTMPGDVRDYSMVNDTKLNEFKAGIGAVWNTGGLSAQFKYYADNVAPYIAEFVPFIPLPIANQFMFWQPWVKAYSGEFVVGYSGPRYNYTKFIWIDTAVKAVMTK